MTEHRAAEQTEMKAKPQNQSKLVQLVRKPLRIVNHCHSCFPESGTL